MDKVLRAFGLDPAQSELRPLHAGHIHTTFHVSGRRQYILQRINTRVFQDPEAIIRNNDRAARHLSEHRPGYRFLQPLPAPDGRKLVTDDQGNCWRLYPYIGNTRSIDKVETKEQAVNAARGFGRLVRFLHGCDVSAFDTVLPDFHNLAVRYGQFETALSAASPERAAAAGQCVESARRFSFLVSEYTRLTGSGLLQPRVMHNDTKISNILFDQSTGEVVCVIDLDTLMPGYFIYDLGDMIRTFVSPAAEDETDYEKIGVRQEIRRAVEDAYLEELGDTLTAQEARLKHFAGPMMTYIMALRFLTDFLDGDRYFQTAHPKHNLHRSENQLRLLELLLESAT